MMFGEHKMLSGFLFVCFNLSSRKPKLRKAQAGKSLLFGDNSPGTVIAQSDVHVHQQAPPVTLTTTARALEAERLSPDMLIMDARPGQR